MTHFDTPSSATTAPTPTAGTDDDTSPSLADKASEATDQGKQAASDVASGAVDRAQDVKDEAVRQARDLAGEARDQLSRHAGGQQESLVANLRALGKELGSMTSASESPGVATELVSQASERVNGVAEWLDGRQPQEILDDVRSFARRRPGAFLLGAAAAGLLTGRLTRGVAAAHSDSGDDGANGTSTAPHATAADAAIPPTANGYSSPPVGSSSDAVAGYGPDAGQGTGFSAPTFTATEQDGTR